MALSMGIECAPRQWRICLIENGLAVETASFADTIAALAYVKHTCAVYPELVLALAADLRTEFTLLQTLLTSDTPIRSFGEQDEQTADLAEFVQVLSTINLKSYSLPPVLYTPAVPTYRRLVRRSPGSSRKVGTLATLLYRLRTRAAEWSEMNFLYLELGQMTYRLVAVRSGQLIDGVDWQATQNAPISCVRELLANKQLVEQAFWEALSQDLTSMMMLHHLEDLVIAEHDTTSNYRDAAIDRLGNTYQCYLFPENEGEAREFTAAYGAALLAEGLYHSGPGAEVARRLLPGDKTEREEQANGHR